MGTIISLLITAFVVVTMLNTKFYGDRLRTPFIVYAGVICMSGFIPALATLIGFLWLLKISMDDNCVETFDWLKNLLH